MNARSSRAAGRSPLLLGLDLGTGSARAVLIERSGRVVGRAERGYPLAVPRPGWAEQDAGRWRKAALWAIAQVAAAAAGRTIAGVGLTGQMHGSVFLDKRDRVIRPPLLWNDQRTAAEAEWIERTAGLGRLIRLTGNRALTGFTAPKLIWLRQHEPENYARLDALLLPKDYIRLALTGVRALECSDASGTGLFDVRCRKFSVELLRDLHLDPALFGPVYEGTQVTAAVSKAAAKLTGLTAGTPVVGGGGDQAAGAVGAGVVAPGELMVSLGTSGVVFAASRAYRFDRRARLHAFCHAGPGLWHLMGVMLNAGGALRWLRSVTGDADYEQLTAEAGRVEPGAEGLLFHPYLMGERTPLNAPNAAGSFYGLNLRHGRGHLVRACLEGVACGLAEALELVRSLGVEARGVRLIGGGARSTLWTSIVADMLGLPVRRLAAEEGPAFGAALLAGVGTGVFSDLDQACAAAVRVGPLREPDPSRVAQYSELLKRWRALRGRLIPLYRE